MSTIHLTDRAAAQRYFDLVYLDDIQEYDPEITTAAPGKCEYCSPSPALVPWFTLCYECATGETCTHEDEDRIQGNGWTACALCGDILTQEEPA